MLAKNILYATCLALGTACGSTPPSADAGATAQQDPDTETSSISTDIVAELPITEPEVAIETAIAVDTPADAAKTCPGAVACPCQTNTDCDNDLCIDGGSGSKVCATPCVNACDKGQICAQISGPTGDLVSVCVAQFPRLCDPCSSSKDCASLGVVGSACVDESAVGHFCGTACKSSGDCPQGYDCASVTSVEGAKSLQCVRNPEGDAAFGTCECSAFAKAQKLATTCFLVAKNGSGDTIGTCAGTRSCGDFGLSLCMAAAPTAESCNGLDDDCDGQTDEQTCNDANVCTTDSCDGLKGCSHIGIDGKGCDADGSVCTEIDKCAGGICVAGSLKNCDDANPCTLDVCDLADGCTHTLDDNIGCSDDNPCTIGDLCQDGQCQPGVDKLCVVAGACATAKCDLNDGKCKFGSAKDGLPCDDGNACTQNDVCLTGNCDGGIASCDDNSVCTNDGCDAKTGCKHTPSNLPCSDNNVCTYGDACDGSVCVGIPKDVSLCNDGNKCTDDSCDSKVGCVNAANFAGCEDGNPCTKDDTCVAGKCATGKPICACEVNSDCAAKEDGDYCNGTFKCDKNDFPYSCQLDINSIVICDPAEDGACTHGQCVAKSGKCVQVPWNEGNDCDADGSVCTKGDTCEKGSCKAGAKIVCDDSNVCTTDSCAPIEGCVFAANALPCDADANPCTVDDACVNKVCVAGAILPCDDGNVCTADACDKGSGACAYVGLPKDGTACDADGNICSVADSCLNGKCIAGLQWVCDDGDECTADSCDPKLACQYAANTAPCNADNNACTVGDACSNKSCLPGKATACDDKNPCTVDACEVKSGLCVYNGLPKNGVPCDADASICTVADACDAGKCAAGKASNCDDANACTDDFCDAKAGCIHVQNPANCDDGNICTDKDSCVDGKCTAGKALNCDDGDACTLDDCNAKTGCTHVAGACDDGDPCTIDTCGPGTCTHSGSVDLPGCTVWKAETKLVCLGGYPPTIDDQGVFWLLGTNTSCSSGDAYYNDILVAVDSKTGVVGVSFPVASPNSQPIWRAGRVTMSTDWNWNQLCPGCQVAYNVPAGSVAWTGGQGPHARGGISMDVDGNIFSSYANILKINVNGGNQWSVGGPGGLGNGTWISGDGSIMGCGTNGTCVVANSSGASKWVKGLSPSAIAADSAGRWYVGSGNGLTIYDSAGNNVGSADLTTAVNVVLLADQGQIVTGGNDGKLRVLDSNAKIVSTWPACVGTSVYPWLLTNGRNAWSLCGDGKVAVVNLDKGLVATLTTPVGTSWIALSADGHPILSDPAGGVRRLAQGGLSYLVSDWPTVDRDARRTRNAKQ